MSTESILVEFAASKLVQLCERIEKCAGKLTPEQIWGRHSENENAIGNLMLHLEGNVRQWVLSGIGGDPDIRARTSEFSAQAGPDAAELIYRLRAVVDRAIAVIRALPPEHLTLLITVQGYNLTLLEAILSVVEHFAGHTGQIIFATKFLTGEDLGFYAYLNTPKAHDAETP